MEGFSSDLTQIREFMGFHGLGANIGWILFESISNKNFILEIVLIILQIHTKQKPSRRIGRAFQQKVSRFNCSYAGSGEVAQPCLVHLHLQQQHGGQLYCNRHLPDHN